MDFVGTNIFVRLLTNDVPEQAARARRIFEAVEEGRREVATSEGILVETVQVLSSKTLYRVARDIIRRDLHWLLSLSGLHIPRKQTYLLALDLYVAYPVLSFVDAICAAHVEQSGYDAVLSFDRGFDRVPGVVRHEP